ncbi:methyl-accepting chemotaxis protein [Pseudomonas sp. LFM046]|uniref:methyl-accepting chemotaxis protein n=1 Tax=Pseudomonas sp. LFM046 TaxID=1608357 RepID=UPI0005CF93CE|nr:methyl-accepting chemotaxis protein [Pseudomonas sp. LFM046]
MPHRLSIQIKTVALAGCCLLAVVLGLVCFSIQRIQDLANQVHAASSSTLKEDAMEFLREAGRHQAVRVSERFSTSYMFANTVSNQILAFRQQAISRGTDPAILREDLFRFLKAQVHGNLEILGIALAFNPDALDGQDSRFIEQGMERGNDSGRFAVYVSHVEDFSIGEKDLQDNGNPANTWFVCPQKSRRSCLIEPYSYPLNGVDTLMSSIAIPLLDGDKLVGVVSLDLTLESLQQLAEDAASTLYEGHGHLSFISSNGTVAGQSAGKNGLGKPISLKEPDRGAKIVAALPGSNPTLLEDGDELGVVTPFAPIPGASHWGVMIEVPESVLLAPALALQETLTKANRSTILSQIGLGAIVAALGMMVMWILAKSITRPILQVAHMLEEFANGDGNLTHRLQYGRQDEMGTLASWFNRFLDKLQPVIAEVSASVSDTRATADQAAKISSEASAGMQHQFREVDQVATAAHEMSATASDVARSAALAADAAQDVEQAARSCMHVIERTNESITLLAGEMNLAMEQVEALSGSSARIGSVLDVIRSVAEQTNLLALNAAIEAARAGESGRGFAVVADEVRHLAKRTQESVSEIQGVIQSLQSETRAVVESMQTSHQRAGSSVQHVEDATRALQKVSSGIDVIGDMNLQIASAAEEQSAVSEEVNRNVSAIRDVTASLAQQAEESAKISRALNSLADQQQRLMENFSA